MEEGNIIINLKKEDSEGKLVAVASMESLETENDKLKPDKHYEANNQLFDIVNVQDTR